MANWNYDKWSGNFKMRLRRWWGIAMVAALSLGWLVPLGTASADNTGKDPIANLLYVQYETPSGVSIDASTDGTGILCSDYEYSGVHWANPDGIKYWINPANSGVAANTAISALNAAFATWDNACGPLSFSYQGTTSLVAGVQDNSNVVSWGDLSAHPGAVALTSVWYDTSTNEIVGADTQMNINLAWSYTAPNVTHDLSGPATPDASRYSDPTNSGVAGTYDIQDIMTHEAGHWLRLADLYSSTQIALTMYGYAATGELKKDTLAYGDELGVEAIYRTIEVSLNTSGLVSSYPITIHYQQGGVAKTDTTYGDWSSSVDYGSTLSIDNTVAVSSTERYSTTDTTSWTVTQAATYSVTYYHQLKPTIAAIAAGAGHTDLSATNYATLTYYSFGSAGTFDVFYAQSFDDWVDMGSTASLSNATSASMSTHRWYGSGTTSWVINDAGYSSATYWEQFKVGIAPTGLNASHPATVNIVQYGTTENVPISVTWSDWADVVSTLSIDNTVAASSTERYSTADTTSWTVTQTRTYSVNYTTQYYLTVQSERGNPQGTGWYDSGSTATISVTSPLGAIIRQAFAGWSGDSNATTATTAISMDSPKSVTANWRTDYTQLYILIGGILAVGMLAICAILLLRKRSKAGDLWIQD